ncbi:uncharacterized protein A1O5_04988 [Cladophialophora psammophila CBS 110553]|uniref:Transcription factor domain-containing protein n=1 Tax=Cladophialophora psammophila CBS 110553 TaxID=1182543 RepID=W9WX25_9EURO|nr:uncharacterized protein A1O5_04988 [Cladophialophora psammophila CBS 110553]EXJ72483.1 hypothetical protein A1O5_04988 [Cladophialophora psammophila CBS 110553]
MRHENDKLERKYHATSKRDTIHHGRSSSYSLLPQSDQSSSDRAETSLPSVDRLDINCGKKLEWQAGNITPPLAQSNSEVAIPFFVANFDQRVYLDYLLKLYGTANWSPLLNASFEAVAMSYLGSRQRSTELRRKTMERYSVALRKTNNAVSTPAMAAQDDTIASVMLLALFTALSCDDTAEASRIWSKHVNAAMKLMLLRSPQGPDGHVVQNLLSHIIGSIHLDCHAQGKTLPPLLTLLRHQSLLSADDFQLRFWDLIDASTNLRLATAEDRVGHLDVIKQALALDEQAQALHGKLASTHDVIAHLEGGICISCDYQSHRRTQACNTMRIIRVDLNQLLLSHAQRCMVSIHDCHSASDQEWLEMQANRATLVLQEVIGELYESIPPFLKKGQYHRTGANPRTNRDMWICSFLWPLSKVAALSGTLSVELGDRIRRQLEHFAEICNNHQLSRAILQQAQGDCALVQYVLLPTLGLDSGWTDAVADFTRCISASWTEKLLK